jgi:prepilin-type N-terminal cleavage/methylation domain-containing protein
VWIVRSHSGLTLVEVLIAVMLVGVALIALAGAFPAAFYAVHGGRHLTTAAALDQEVIEGAKRLAFTNVTATSLGTLYPSPPPGYAGYTRVIQVDDILDAGAVVMKRVTVTTSYNLYGSTPSVPMVTLLAR